MFKAFPPNSLSTRKLLIAALAIAALGFACGEDENDRKEELAQGNVIVGQYNSSRCFKNKIATAAALGADRFSTADFNLSQDGTGSVLFRVYTDVNCTALDREDNVPLTNIRVEAMGNGSVLVVDQANVVLNPTWYIPVVTSNEGYHFDVDYTDGTSGPYFTAPSGAELSEFFSNPAVQGVEFKKVD